MLCEAVDKFKSHSYIAKSQTKYLKERKGKLKKESCIALFEFCVKLCGYRSRRNSKLLEQI